MGHSLGSRHPLPPYSKMGESLLLGESGAGFTRGSALLIAVSAPGFCNRPGPRVGPISSYSCYLTPGMTSQLASVAFWNECPT